MPEGPLFTVLDDENHVIGLDEITVCDLPIPHGNGFTTDRPAKVCATCAERAFGETPPDEEPAPAPKASKGK